ncbi:orexigenic neuropeptide QRFP [Octodon degus]|uniref:Orexigenic neuropeptide QRFP n=1 Tax=Octodon degus TaxID=10160 RepID=A0A6P3FIV7_OCTDE|nr:orexigenic neuropeptide QRFP [Octodon degus]
MRGPSSLPYLLLLLPIGACLPLLDLREPPDSVGGTGAGSSGAHLVKGHGTHSAWGSTWRVGAPQPQALLLVARNVQALGSRHTSLRLGRQEGSKATGFLPADGNEKATGPLGNLAEELNGYSRKKGGFSFRFGRG